MGLDRHHTSVIEQSCGVVNSLFAWDNLSRAVFGSRLPREAEFRSILPILSLVQASRLARYENKCDVRNQDIDVKYKQSSDARTALVDRACEQNI